MTDRGKIKETHLARAAYVYIRQSTTTQLENNLESQRRQYQQEKDMLALGFKAVVVIDEDMGISGSGLHNRPGFKRLLAEVGARKIGLIMGLEVSRLSRNGREWNTLLELCEVTDTLIGDQHGIYCPTDANERLMLELKGSFGGQELRVLNDRMTAGLWNKAKRGELFFNIPAGYVKTTEDQLEKDPDQRIQNIIESVFAKFTEVGSIRQTYLYFCDRQIEIPVQSSGKFGKQWQWKVPGYSYLRCILSNPIYAGTYVFGRRKTTKELIDGKVVLKTRMLKPDQWKIVIPGNHPGYITEEEHQKIQEQIGKNRQGEASGAALRGQALLARMMRCGRCGRSLSVHYSGKNGAVTRYDCAGIRKGEARTSCCIRFSGRGVDEAVTVQLLEAIGPLGVEAAIEAQTSLDHEGNKQNVHLKLALQQAEFEAERAYRQYDQADPENRLVTATLEKKWNDKLECAQQLQERLDTAPTLRPLTQEEIVELHQLAQDLPLLWNVQTTTAVMRKRILRAAVEVVMADVDDENNRIVLEIHWKGGAHTTIRLAKESCRGKSCTAQEVVELIKQLSRQMPDRHIVALLNKLGYKTAADNAWTDGRLRATRSRHKIGQYNPKVDGVYLTLKQTARRLQITTRQVKLLIDREVLQGHQITAYAPWAIKNDQMDSPCLKEVVYSLKKGPNRPGNCPRTLDQLTLF